MSSVKKAWMKERLADRRWTRYSKWTCLQIKRNAEVYFDFDWWHHAIIPSTKIVWIHQPEWMTGLPLASKRVPINPHLLIDDNTALLPESELP